MGFKLNPFTGKLDAVDSPNELDDYEEGTWTPRKGLVFTHNRRLHCIWDLYENWQGLSCTLR
jgi:hypothetical protein